MGNPTLPEVFPEPKKINPKLTYRQIFKKLLIQDILLNDLAKLCIDLPNLTRAIEYYYLQDSKWQQAYNVRLQANQNRRKSRSRGASFKTITRNVIKSFLEDELNKKIRGGDPSKIKPHYIFLLRNLNNIFKTRTDKKLRYISAILRFFNIHLESFCKDCKFFKYYRCQKGSVYLCLKRQKHESIIHQQIKNL